MNKKILLQERIQKKRKQKGKISGKETATHWNSKLEIPKSGNYGYFNIQEVMKLRRENTTSKSEVELE